jgi:hypothetical protein
MKARSILTIIMSLLGAYILVITPNLPWYIILFTLLGIFYVIDWLESY